MKNLQQKLEKVQQQISNFEHTIFNTKIILAEQNQHLQDVIIDMEELAEPQGGLMCDMFGKDLELTEKHITALKRKIKNHNNILDTLSGEENALEMEMYEELDNAVIEEAPTLLAFDSVLNTSINEEEDCCYLFNNKDAEKVAIQDILIEMVTTTKEVTKSMVLTTIECLTGLGTYEANIMYHSTLLS